MRISIEHLEINNFKAHKSLDILFDEIVNISGKNGEGKSSIGDAISWNLCGTDMLGSIIDPTPLQNFEGETSTTLVLNIDGKTMKMKRSIENGKNSFYVNDVPRKATEYKELIDSVIDKDLLLSIFNPNYFSSQHWKEQRQQLLKYIDEPLNKVVLEQMQNVHRAALEGPLKKHSLNELDKLHRDRFKKRDKDIEGARTRVSTLKEQLEKSMGAGNVDLVEIQSRLTEVEKEISKGQLYNEGISMHEKDIEKMKSDEIEIRTKIMKKKASIDQMVAISIEENCDSCGQTLDYNAREQLKITYSNELEKIKQSGRELVGTLEKLRHALESITQPETRLDISELFVISEEYRHILLDSERIRQLQKEVEEAEGAYTLIRSERLESLGIIDSIKIFVDKKAGMMVDKVNSLFDTLSVRLFEKQKNDSFKQTFEIEMDGKPYQKLSTAERIRCGIELIHVLQEQSGIVFPTFIDNAESILNLKVADGQAVIATVKNHKLKIEVSGQQGEQTA